MNKWLGASLMATALSYVSSPENKPFGDFTFSYPKDLVVHQDYVYSEAAVVPGAKHVVVLRHRGAAAGDLRSIEINMLRSLRRPLSCSDYSLCKTIDGVVIGTDSEDPEFQRAFEAIVSSFKAVKDPNFYTRDPM